MAKAAKSSDTSHETSKSETSSLRTTSIYGVRRLTERQRQRLTRRTVKMHIVVGALSLATAIGCLAQHVATAPVGYGGACGLL